MAITPEPKWQSIEKDGNFEIRSYDPMIIAQVTTKGERYAAINAGFRVLAAYIFGENTIKQKIAMTTPVTQHAGNVKGQKIAMTAPVTQEPSKNQNEWVVRFIMPQNYTIATLPVPNDARIELLEIPAYNAAIIRFSGFNTDQNLNKHQEKLIKWLKKNNIKTIGNPTYAFYNPPWIPPFLKRNEIMLKISE